MAKVTKSGTGVGAAKEKKALDYGSDDFSSSSGDNLTLKATMGKHSIKGLCVCVSCLSTGKSRPVDILRTIESCASYLPHLTSLTHGIFSNWYWCLD